MGNGENPCPLPLLSLNHVSLVCKSVESSSRFYKDVLGFQLIKRPSSFDFEGAWLFNYGVGIHLLQCNSVDDLPKKAEINPRDNHISFQCTDIGIVERRLEDINMKYEKRVVEEGGIYVDQIFFHDPDGYMIEICNCHVLPIIPLTECQAPPATRSKFSWLKSTSQKERKESFSDIYPVAINSNPDQVELSAFKKGVESPKNERSCPYEALEDEKPVFLDIMNFYL